MRTRPTTTKKEIIERIALQTGQRRNAVKRTLQCFLQNIIVEMQAGNRLELRDFGVFEIAERSERVGKNPRTLEPVMIPPRKIVRFKAGQLMKELLESNGQVLGTMNDREDDIDDSEE